MDEPTTDQSPPRCLVILIPLSASMNADVRVWLAHRFTEEGEPELREVPRRLAAQFVADELIEGLVNSIAAGYPLTLDLAVIGYSADDAGQTKFTSLLPGEDGGVRFVPISEIASREAQPRGRESDPRKWTSPAACEGTAPATTALAEVYRLVSVWLTSRYTARPPVVLHITDGEELGDSYLWIARSLGLLTTGYGPARLLHVGLTDACEPILSGTEAGELSQPWANLAHVSAELLAEPEGRPARRAVSVNDWSINDAWSALFDSTWLEETINWTEDENYRFDPTTARGIWTHKLGNTPEQWEDAYATDPASGVAAIADGASSGIYCRSWADQLTKAFIADRPDARDPIALGKWIHGLRGEWRTAINYETLNWSKQAKVDDVGAAATLLGLELGSTNARGNRPWRAFAVGDACLFWVRDGQLIGTFPVVAEEQFGSVPLLVRSNHGFKTLAVAAAGECHIGDQFILATDAVAARLFRSATGPGPHWEAFETIEETAWREELDTLRKANDMVNDDCTLVSLRVTDNKPIALQELPPVAVTESIRDESEGAIEVAEQNGEPTDTPTQFDQESDNDNARTTARDGFSDSTEDAV